MCVACVSVIAETKWRMRIPCASCRETHTHRHIHHVQIVLILPASTTSCWKPPRSVPSHDNRFHSCLLHYAMVPFLCNFIRLSLLHDVPLLFWLGFQIAIPLFTHTPRVEHCVAMIYVEVATVGAQQMPLKQPLPAQQGCVCLKRQAATD